MHANVFRGKFTYVCKFTVYQKIRWIDGWTEDICDKASIVKYWWQNLGDKLIGVHYKFLLTCIFIYI